MKEINKKKLLAVLEKIKKHAHDTGDGRLNELYMEAKKIVNEKEGGAETHDDDSGSNPPGGPPGNKPPGGG